MKARTALFMLVILGCADPISAQFPNFPDSNALWLMDVYGQPGFIEQYGYHLRASDHDTLINGTWYNTLWAGAEAQGGAFSGGLRGDAQHRVYYYHPNTNIEYLLYDFAPTVGDTIQVWIGDSQSSTYIPQLIHIVSIEQLQNTQGDQYKVIGIVNDTQFDQAGQEAAEFWIEGVGGTGGLLSTFGLYFYPMNVAFLSCMQHNDTIWPSGEVGMCSPVGTQERTAATIKVYPNPNEGEFTVQLSTGQSVVLAVHLLDALGHQVPFSVHRSSGRLNCSISGTAPGGVYTLLLFFTDGMVSRARVVLRP